MGFGNMLKSNWIYVIFFGLYFLIAVLAFISVPHGFWIVLAVYVVSITIAISPIGENLLRFMNGVRRISTLQEKEYIYPLFDEVYNRAKETTPNLSDDIEIFMTDEMHVNAYAFGRNTVVVTRGLIQTMDEEQIMGILAHEFGHIVHGHTLMLLVSLIGNGIFSIFILIARMFMFFFELMLHGMDNGGGFGKFMAKMSHIMFEWSLIWVMYFVTAMLAINSRKHEYQADAYALDIGFGEGLLNGLYIFQRMDMGRRTKIIERITSSHPHIAYRIERLENSSIKQLTADK